MCFTVAFILINLNLFSRQNRDFKVIVASSYMKFDFRYEKHNIFRMFRKSEQHLTISNYLYVVLFS